MTDDHDQGDQGDQGDVATPAMLRIVNPDATPEEIAAIVAVFASLGGRAPLPRRPRSAWSSPQRAVRRSVPTGPAGWRVSTLPR